MPKLFVFAIGGTGSRVLKALTFLLASGVQLKNTDEVIPIVLDTHANNDDLLRTKDLLREYGNGAFLVSKFIGGVSMHRDHVDDPNGRDPLVVVPPEKQRAALWEVFARVREDEGEAFEHNSIRNDGNGSSGFTRRGTSKKIR